MKPMGPLYAALLWAFAFGAARAGGGTAVPSPTPAPAPVHYVETGSSHESLTNDRGTWDDQYVRFVKSDANHQQVYASLESTQRYGKRDDRETFGFYLPLGPNWLANVEAAASNSHHVLPSSSVSAIVQYSSGAHWYEGAGVRNVQYDAGTVNEELVTLEHYWSSYRFSYMLTVATLSGTGTQSEHSFEMDRYYGNDSSFVALSYVTGREIDDFGLSALEVSSVRGWSLGGRHWVAPNWAIAYGYSRNEQGTLYTRTGERVALDYRF